MVHRLSLVCCPLTIARINEAGEIVASSIGSGFLWRHEERCYLITNWHNVTGINPDSGKMHGSFIPNVLLVTVKDIVSHAGETSEVRNLVVPVSLYMDFGGAPKWLEHPRRGEVDCVAVPIEFPHEHTKSYAIQDCGLETDLRPEVGIDCFVVGYPRGMEGPRKTPIWKRGTIATEPEAGIDGKPMLLIDTATRKGMSGSPVIYRHHGYQDDGFTIGKNQGLLGIYSGRIGEDEIGVQLGRVWRANAIDELMASGVQGIDPMEQ